ncbi:unnamed protein product [Urochloa humidicola]
MLVSGPESKRKQKLQARQVMHAVEPPTPAYLRWSEVPITFSREDHPGCVINPGHYALVVVPTIRNTKMTKVLVDGGCGLNVLFVGALKEFGLSVHDLTLPQSSFYGLLPGEPATPLGHIVLPVTFGDRSNYRTEHLRVITVEGDLRVAYACEKETLDAAAALELSTRMGEVLTAAKTMDPEELEIPTKKPSKEAIKPKPTDVKKVSLDLLDASKTVTIGSNLDPK